MIFIRADANEHIGTGHVMRCLSVASAFSSINEDVLFITADNRGDKLIKSKGFRSVCLGSNWNRLDEELGSFADLIEEKGPKLILIDSYYVTRKYTETLTQKIKTAYFDDFNAHTWDVDYLINYNIYATISDYSNYDYLKTELLLGTDYAPLRAEFKKLPPHTNKKEITDVLISAGGADPERVTERLIETICPRWESVRFHFIVGALNPRIDSIRSLSGGNAILHINEKNMSEMMTRCDLAISAAGTTLYELCASGIPTITYTLADNQLLAAEQFEKQGIMLSAGDCRGDSQFEERINMYLKRMAYSKELRERITMKMQTVVDGNGADRIASTVLQ